LDLSRLIQPDTVRAPARCRPAPCYGKSDSAARRNQLRIWAECRMHPDSRPGQFQLAARKL